MFIWGFTIPNRARPMLPGISPFGAVLSISVITDLLCLLFVWQFPASFHTFLARDRAHAEQNISIRKTHRVDAHRHPVSC
jgi:hypothetical protein